MRYCPSCKAWVTHPYIYCPLCQNELSEKNEDELKTNILENDEEVKADEQRYYPEVKAIRKISLADKIQLFVVLIAIINSLFFDFSFGLHGSMHWSIFCLIWGMGIEFILRPIFKRRIVPASFTTRVAIVISISMLLTAYYIGFLKVCVDWIVPSIILATLLANIIYLIVGKGEEKLVHALYILLLGTVPELIMFLVFHEVTLMWKVCLITCITSFLGLVFFVGAKVNTEIHKQLNI